jgi:hypothetical protein
LCQIIAGKGIEIADYISRYDLKRLAMTCASIGGDDQIGGLDKIRSRFMTREYPIGKDDGSHEKNPSAGAEG